MWIDQQQESLNNPVSILSVQRKGWRVHFFPRSPVRIVFILNDKRTLLRSPKDFFARPRIVVAATCGGETRIGGPIIITRRRTDAKGRVAGYKRGNAAARRIRQGCLTCLVERQSAACPIVGVVVGRHTVPIPFSYKRRLPVTLRRKDIPFLSQMPACVHSDHRYRAPWRILSPDLSRLFPRFCIKFKFPASS